MKVVLVGNPIDGYGVYGPFEDYEDASGWADGALDDDWCTATVHPSDPAMAAMDPVDYTPSDTELNFAIVLSALLKTHVINWEQIAQTAGCQQDELLEIFEKATKFATQELGETPVEAQEVDVAAWGDGAITLAPTTWGTLANEVAGNIPTNDTTGIVLPDGLTDYMPGMITFNTPLENLIGKDAQIIFDEIADNLDAIDSNIEKLAALKKFEDIVIEPEDSVPTEG